jgi:hypothetical protein
MVKTYAQTNRKNKLSKYLMAFEKVILDFLSSELLHITYFNTEDGGSMFLRNYSIHLQGRKPQYPLHSI